MKLGVFSSVFGDLDLEPMLDRVVELGLDAVEIGTGAYPGNRHCKPDELLADDGRMRAFQRAVDARGLEISALSCHGNPVHPDRSSSRRDDSVYRSTVELAARLGVQRVNLFAGCPGDGPAGSQPNWVTCAWPPEFLGVLRWQWDEVVLPYWREAAQFAEDRGVRLAFEMHPGTVVYNPRTLKRLRDACGEVVGVNFDPSHLFWQAIDPVVAVKALAGAIYHVHAKDTAFNPQIMAVDGVLDTREPNDAAGRSWVFCSVGDGHDVSFWKRFIGALREAGYDHVVSIEHEDPVVSIDEGLARAVQVLRR